MAETTNSMIERVARVLARQRGDVTFAFKATGFQQQVASGMSVPTIENWQNHVDDARAVLTAMREPTETMVEAGDACDHHSSFGPDANADCDVHWSAMIDAALEDGQ